MPRHKPTKEKQDIFLILNANELGEGGNVLEYLI